MKTLQALSIRAMDGSIFADGKIRMESNSNADLPISASGQQVGVRFERQSPHTAYFSLFRNVRRMGDGLYGASAPELQISFPRAADPLELLSGSQKKGRKQVNCYDTPIASVSFRDPRLADDDPRSLYASSSCVNYEYEPSEEGWLIGFEMMVSPSQSVSQEPIFEQAKVFGSIDLPAAYCALRGIEKPFSMYGGNSIRQSGPSIDESKMLNPGLENSAISIHGSPFCPGQIDWNDKSDLRRPTGPFVSLSLRNNQMTISPAGSLQRLANGFASETNSYGGGPKLTLPFGFDDWIRMLGDNNKVEVCQSGGGIGYLEGTTGREAYETGGLKQAVTQSQFSLSRQRDGLLVRGSGKLGPLTIQVDWAKPLGPEFKFEFVIPRTWILSQGFRLPKFWEEWKSDFPSDDTW